jgi:Skp family chaperone for outer membrane proteins
MNGVSSALLIVSMVLFLGCEDKETKAENYDLRVENQNLKNQNDELNQTAVDANNSVANAEQAIEDARVEAEALAKAEAEKQEALRQKAEETPMQISNIHIANVTENGTELKSDGESSAVFSKYDVNYIQWSVDYTNNVAIAKMKANGKLYIQFIDKNGYISSQQGYFYNSDGDYVDYTTVKEISDNDIENGTWSGTLGSESSGAFERGKWIVRFYWDNNNKGKATTYLGEESFEIR